MRRRGAARSRWIADIRESLGMTGKDLARGLGIDPSSAKRLEQSCAFGEEAQSGISRMRQPAEGTP